MSRRASSRIPGLVALVVAGTAVVAPGPVAAQAVGREAAESLRYPRLRFHAPEPAEHEVDGVSVLFLEDHSVPLVTLYARFKGGYSLLGRPYYAAASALPSLLRYGGTETLPPDSVDGRLAYYAIQTTFGGGGETLFTSMNTLTEHLDSALSLWGDMLRRPRFDSSEIEVWRGRELEAVRRRGDDPQRLAFGEFNRLLYGNHPVGWEMDTLDLRPERLAPEVFQDLRGRILCPENLVLGATGDVSWKDLEPRLHRMLDDWPACSDTLLAYPEPDIRKGPGVFLIPRKLDQAVLVMAHATDVHMGLTPEYFAAQIGNSILGSGGFNSRILSRVRTEEGFAYSAASLWTMPHRYQGLLGAVTRTKPETAVPALKLILSIMEDMTKAPPTRQEMKTTVDQIVNGFVFNFETPGQIVARRMFYLAQGLPRDWLERYLEGVEDVTAARVERVFRKYLHPDEMIIMVVGDPDRIGRDALASLGPVTVLDIPPGGGAPSPR